ncbi:uncharacterized protein BXZ73DRAFT_56902, partial [Epithele typhae]|uniref:uncharacterized protein n=1 Tax=Epithele typhae TaxID=378194 RepID=UPI002007B149
DIKTEYHPHSRCPAFVRHADSLRHDTPITQSMYQAAKSPHHPFESRLDFEFAEFTAKTGLNEGEIASLLCLISGITANPANFHIKSCKDLDSLIEYIITSRPQFTCTTIKADYGDSIQSYPFHHLDLWDWALGLIQDPILAEHFEWYPKRQYRWNGQKWTRFVDEPFTANRCWDIQTDLPDDVFMVAFHLYADKTRLSSFGGQKGYPIVARLANLPAHIRNSSEYGGGQVVGFLPIVEDELEEGKAGFVALKRIVWHESFKVLLEKISHYARLGHRAECGDGIPRTLLPYILIKSADYEEQCIMSLIRGMNSACPCPICLVPRDKQVVLAPQPLYPRRDVQAIKALVRRRDLPAKEKEALCKATGIRDLENVFWSIPYSDPYSTLSFDRLHAYHGGLFSDHLLTEFQSVVGTLRKEQQAEVNDAFSAMPRWRGLNHFDEVTTVSFTDGSKYEDMSKVVIVPASYAAFRSKHLRLSRGFIILKCIRLYNILDIYAGLECHTEETLEAFKLTLVLFYEAIQEYMQVYPGKNWNFPKMHSQQHAPDDILQKGATLHFNTKTFETMHGPLKDIYLTRTNFKNFEAQIAKHEQRLATARRIRRHLDASSPSQPDQRLSVSKESDSQFGHTYIGAPQSPISLQALLDANVKNPLYTQFFSQLQIFLQQNPGLQNTTVNRDTLITEYQFLKIDFTSKVTWKTETDYLRCNPDFHNAPRYDSFIYQPWNNLSAPVEFARLQLIFTILSGGKSYPIVFAEAFDRLEQRPEYDKPLGLCRLQSPSPHRCIFLPLQSMIRGAMITNDPGQGHGGNDYLAIDIVDSDMFLRLKEAVPEWYS